MFSKLREIAEAWITAANPTNEQKKLAEARYNICVGCEHYRDNLIKVGPPYCNDCGCPISKKIFSKGFDACPQHKWIPAEEKYWDATQKKSKTLV